MIYVEVLNHSRNFKCPSAIEYNLCSVAFALLEGSMARSIEQEFYNSTIWRKCAKDYLKYCNGLCERCKANGIYVPASIVHHRKHLTRKNRNDPRMAYGLDNLEALCIACHNQEHFAGSRKNRRWAVDGLGKVTPLSNEKGA